MSNDLSRHFTLYLSRLAGIGPKTFRYLIDQFGDAGKILEAWNNKEEITEKFNFSNWEDKYEEIDSFLKKNSTYYVAWGDGNYPISLRNIPDAPAILYYRGDISKLNSFVSTAIVGTRKPTDYGIRQAKYFSKTACYHNNIVVSGLAVGIDAQAHTTSIEENGITVAVLGGDLDNGYPKTNNKLYKQIVNSGGVALTEIFPGTKINPGMFASRNRIIAGLSKTTIVIEAGKNSGALITARVAFDYNRQVFAVPGGLDSFSSSGCNQLILDQQAEILCSPEQIWRDKQLLNMVKKDIPVINSDHMELLDLLKSKSLFLEEICVQVDKTSSSVISLLMYLKSQNLISLQSDGKYKSEI